jgi:hypothetical protein
MPSWFINNGDRLADAGRKTLELEQLILKADKSQSQEEKSTLNQEISKTKQAIESLILEGLKAQCLQNRSKYNKKKTPQYQNLYRLALRQLISIHEKEFCMQILLAAFQQKLDLNLDVEIKKLIGNSDLKKLNQNSHSRTLSRRDSFDDSSLINPSKTQMVRKATPPSSQHSHQPLPHRKRKSLFSKRRSLPENILYEQISKANLAEDEPEQLKKEPISSNSSIELTKTRWQCLTDPKRINHSQITSGSQTYKIPPALEMFTDELCREKMIVAKINEGTTQIIDYIPARKYQEVYYHLINSQALKRGLTQNHLAYLGNQDSELGEAINFQFYQAMHRIRYHRAMWLKWAAGLTLSHTVGLLFIATAPLIAALAYTAAAYFTAHFIISFSHQNHDANSDTTWLQINTLAEGLSVDDCALNYGVSEKLIIQLNPGVIETNFFFEKGSSINIPSPKAKRNWLINPNAPYYKLQQIFLTVLLGLLLVSMQPTLMTAASMSLCFSLGMILNPKKIASFIFPDNSTNHSTIHHLHPNQEDKLHPGLEEHLETVNQIIDYFVNQMMPLTLAHPVYPEKMYPLDPNCLYQTKEESNSRGQKDTFIQFKEQPSLYPSFFASALSGENPCEVAGAMILKMQETINKRIENQITWRYHHNNSKLKFQPLAPSTIEEIKETELLADVYYAVSYQDLMPNDLPHRTGEISVMRAPHIKKPCSNHLKGSTLIALQDSINNSPLLPATQPPSYEAINFPKDTVFNFKAMLQPQPKVARNPT